MITALLAALRAIPRLVDAMEMVAEGITLINSQMREKEAKGRLDEKNELVDDLINRARDMRLRRDREVSGGDGPDNSPSEGV